MASIIGACRGKEGRRDWWFDMDTVWGDHTHLSGEYLEPLGDRLRVDARIVLQPKRREEVLSFFSGWLEVPRELVIGEVE